MDTGWSLHGIPSNIKVKKVIRVRPLELGGTLTWNLETHDVKYRLSCKETILGGKINLDTENKAVEYKKRISPPMIKFGHIVLGARWQWMMDTNSIKPSYSVGWELRQGTAEIIKVNSVRVKPRLFYKHVGIEAVTDITFTMPKSLRFDLPVGGASSAGASRGTVSKDDDGSWAVDLDVKELNLVFVL